MIQIGEADDEEKPKFASLMKDQSIHNIELEEALKLFEWPRQLGEYKDVLVEANVGRYGPYVKYGDMFVSIQRGDGLMEIPLDRAIELSEGTRKEHARI